MAKSSKRKRKEQEEAEAAKRFKRETINKLALQMIEIQDNKKVELKMLHFFINTGIRDNAYYWNELLKCLKV